MPHKPGGFLRVSVAQINTTVGAIDANASKIISALNEAAQTCSDLVVFPELTITGYPPEDLLYNPSFIRRNIEALRKLARHRKTPSFVVGFVDPGRSGALYNSAAFIQNGKIQTIYHKCELPNYGVFDERRYFEAGTSGGVIQLSKKLRIGLSICEDMWEKKSFLYNPNFHKNLSFLINISASPYHAGKHANRLGLVRGLAKTAGMPVVYANLVGGQDELVFDGGSMIVDSRGHLLSEAPQFTEGLICADIPCSDEAFNQIRRPSPRLKKRSMISATREVYQALVLGTRDYVEKNGFSKVLIGLSGGIDSALVASIACDALGSKRVVGVTMPSRYTSSETLKDALRLAKNMGFTCHTLHIEPIFKAYLSSLAPFFEQLPPNIAEENLQARIRGNLLMAFSNKWGHLVLTTGNKSEMATGYCTLYGDMAGGFAVIKDVPKTLVFQLANERNSQQKGDWIPPSIVRRPPSAELKPNQKDQDTLPPYPLLDSILKDYIELDRDVADMSSYKSHAPLVKRVVKMVDKSEYKRRQAPPGIKITPKAFGRDRRMPITNRFEAL